jgi:RNA polymerase-associated protein
MTVLTKRSVMTLFTNKLCPYSHTVRIVLAEKGVAADLVEVDMANKPEELLELNPYGTVPTLVDRDLVLYDTGIILEYLEERFPHPPLMPVYPVARARNRLMMLRIERDWYSLVNKVMAGGKESEKARKDLGDSLLAVAPVFADSPYFLSEEFSLVDCSLAALLWRLPHLGVQLPVQAKAIAKYAAKLFKRDSFAASLSDAEKAMRESE